MVAAHRPVPLTLIPSENDIHNAVLQALMPQTIVRLVARLKTTIFKKRCRERNHWAHPRIVKFNIPRTRKVLAKKKIRFADILRPIAHGFHRLDVSELLEFVPHFVIVNLARLRVSEGDLEAPLQLLQNDQSIEFSRQIDINRPDSCRGHLPSHDRHGEVNSGRRSGNRSMRILFAGRKGNLRDAH